MRPSTLETMQTFLPYADFEKSARALDTKRLGKQRVETIQVVRALTWEGYGWRSPPAVVR
ncbi:MAG: pyrimidine dimer DNA glycosylase/endonuclease V [Marmoricola sp.]